MSAQSAMPRSIAFVMSPELRLFFIAFARQLKERTGASIHAYVSTKEEVAFYEQRADAGLFATVRNSGSYLRDRATEPSGAALMREAADWERRIGSTFGRLAVGNRHFGRGFALGGSGHPRSRLSESFDLDAMTRAYVLQARFWDAELAANDFDLVIGGAPLLFLLAEKRGIAYRALLGSRYKNLHFWAQDAYFHSPAVEARFRALAQSEHTDADIAEPYKVERTHRKVFTDQDTLLGLAGKLGMRTARYYYHLLRGYEKAKGYYLSEELKHIARIWSDTRLMTGRSTLPLAALEGRPFIFFPLHTEPEASVGQASPEFFYQHAAIAALARDLPAGCLLAVKETIHGVGRRPPDFYRQIADLKNVVWLDMMEYGLEVVRKAVGVATITGTAGMEAAVMGKPVIAFGRHNIYNFLDHVVATTDLSDLTAPIGAMVRGEIDLEKARRDGARYLRAVQDTSFDMRGYDYIDHAAFEAATVTDALDSLLSTLPSAASALRREDAAAV